MIPVPALAVPYAAPISVEKNKNKMNGERVGTCVRHGKRIETNAGGSKHSEWIEQCPARSVYFRVEGERGCLPLGLHPLAKIEHARIHCDAPAAFILQWRTIASARSVSFFVSLSISTSTDGSIDCIYLSHGIMTWQSITHSKKKRRGNSNVLAKMQLAATPRYPKMGAIEGH